jgi:hypothetical protein
VDRDRGKTAAGSVRHRSMTMIEDLVLPSSDRSAHPDEETERTEK